MTTNSLDPNRRATQTHAARTPAAPTQTRPEPAVAPPAQPSVSGSGWTAIVSNDGGASKSSPLKNARFTNDDGFARIANGQVVLGVGPIPESAKGVVTKLQQSLTDMGFADPDWTRDGKFGPQTERGIRNFQVNASRMFPDVKVTGKLDAATLKAMDELAPPPGQQGQTKNVPKGIYVDPKTGKEVKLKALALKDEHRTFIFDDKGNVSKIVINAVGKPPTEGMTTGNKNSRTNEGLMKVDAKWDKDGIQRNMRPPKFDPKNYGEHMLPLSHSDGRNTPHEFHGTNHGEQLGMDASAGCVRHSREGARALYESLSVGDRVAILQNSDKRVQWR